MRASSRAVTEFLFISNCCEGLGTVEAGLLPSWVPASAAVALCTVGSRLIRRRDSLPANGAGRRRFHEGIVADGNHQDINALFRLRLKMSMALLHGVVAAWKVSQCTGAKVEVDCEPALQRGNSEENGWSEKEGEKARQSRVVPMTGAFSSKHRTGMRSITQEAAVRCTVVLVPVR